MLDIVNNLNLYCAPISLNRGIEPAHFSAILKTGVRPLRAGHDIEVVAMSWINRNCSASGPNILSGRSLLNAVRIAYRSSRSLANQR